MKLKFFLFFIFISTINFYSQTVYDTVKAEKVGPGMTHYYLKNYTTPWAVNIFEVDLANQYVGIETVKGGGRVTGLETTSSMASRNSREGHKVIAATNADFWGANVPIGKQISNGEIVKMYQDHAYPLSSMIFNENKKPYLNNVSFSCSITAKDTSAVIYGVNRTRETDKFVLYNKFMGASTGTNEYGTEVVLTPISGWIVNDTIKLVVNEIIPRVGNAAIPSGKVVLSGHGLSEQFISKKLQINDTVKILFTINAGTKERVNQLIGGYPKIVKDGVNYAVQGMAEEGGPDHGVGREPRTAVGFSQDSTKLYLFTVDGRQSSLSAGMTLAELADVMIQSGVYQGMNFDGGGSTTMVIRDAIVNSPSDATGERTVSNSIQVISSAPDGNLSILQMSPKSSRLFFGEKTQYSVKGWDEYFNPYSIDQAKVTYSLTGNFGSITSEGLFTAGEKADTGYVITSYEGLKDSAKVIVKGVEKVSLSPVRITLDTVKSVVFTVKSYDMDNIVHILPASRYKWESSDKTVGEIDTVGRFKGKKEGLVQIYASYGELKDTAEVKVEIGLGKQLVKSLTSLEGLTASGVGLDSVKLSVEKVDGKDAVRADYWYRGNPSLINYVHINMDIPVYGVPDSIKITARSSNNKNNIMEVYLKDDNSELFQINARAYVNNTESFTELPAPFQYLTPAQKNAVFYYPVRISAMKIKLGEARLEGVKYAGYFYVNDIYATYPQSMIGIEGDETEMPEKFSLSQNYPNPFNPSTKIRFSIEKAAHVSLRIYDILGREVAVMAEEYMKAGEHQLEWNAASYPSGVYIYRLNVEGRQVSKKMALVK